MAEYGDSSTWPYTAEDGSKARDIENGGKLFQASDGTLTFTDKSGETYKMVRCEGCAKMN